MAEQDNERWLIFLRDLLAGLSDFNVYSGRRNLKTRYDELLKIVSRGQNEDYGYIQHNLNILAQDLKTYYGNIPLDREKVRTLHDFLTTFLQSDEPTFEHPNSKKLVVKDWFVTVSSLNRYIKQNPKIVEALEDVEIFALEKVFIDEEINFSGRKVQLTIISPTWEVVQKSSWDKLNIILDGKHGDSYGEDAGVLSVPGSDGNDGKQGLPGGHAGNFLGVGMSCDTCGMLKISAIGGRGGPGQDGGPGMDGKDGRNPTNSDSGAFVMSSCRIMEDNWALEGSKAKCDSVFSESYWFTGSWGYNKNCIVSGNGRPGGKGGNGGPGGRGGNAGHAKILMMNNPQLSLDFIPSAKERPGFPGRGGKGGSGGIKKIWDLQLSSECEDMNCNCKVRKGHDDRREEPYPPSRDGMPGMPVRESEMGTHQSEPRFFINPSYVINEYKIYLLANLKNKFMAQRMKAFLTHLETDERVNELYDLLGLLNDFIGLEGPAGQELPDYLRHLSYERLLSRVKIYKIRPHEKKDQKNFQKALGYMHSALSTRIHDIESDINKDLVVDVRKNLEYMKNNIQEWKNFKDLVEKNKVRNRYKDGILKKIAEASAFIENEITKDIEKNIESTTKQLNKLYAEVEKLQNAAEEEKDALNDRKKKLENQLMMRGMFGVLQIASQALVFTGPIGAAAGAVIGGVASVGESLATSDNPDVAVSAMPTAISTTLTKLNTAYKEKQESFKKQLTEANKQMEDFLNDEKVVKDQSSAKKKVQEIQTQFASAKKRYDDLVEQGQISNPESVSKMYELRKEIDGILEKGKKEVGGLGNGDKYKNAVDKLQTMVGMAKMGVDLYSKMKGDMEKITQVDESIAAVNAKMGKLDQYEESIYTKIGPMVTRIQASVHSAGNSEGKSHAALDVTNWQVQGSIRDVRKEMEEMTKGFPAGNDITYYIDKVVYAMSMMIQMFDRIQTYTEQGDLVDVITDVDSAADILNSELYTAISELKMRISSNILSEYTNSISAVKQYVFPFGVEYFEHLTLPEGFNLDKTDELVYNIQALQKALHREDSTTLARESFIMADVTFAEKNNHPPFFIWNDYNKIKQLFQGGTIQLSADITRATIPENAVKFNDIWIRFKSNDQTLQSQLDKELAKYTVRLTHLGDSTYKCQTDIYRVDHKKQDIRHTFRRKPYGGSYKEGNIIYTKITHNEPMLSPFATWEIALEPEHTGFAGLKPFVNANFEVILEGQGSYVKYNGLKCNGLKNHYTFERSTAKQMRTIGLSGYEELLAQLNEYSKQQALEAQSIESAEPSYGVRYENNNSIDWITTGNLTTTDFFNAPNNSNHHQISTVEGDDTASQLSSQVSPVGVSNLPLFELMIRKMNGTKRLQKREMPNQRSDNEGYAHNLAYSSYAPKGLQRH